MTSDEQQIRDLVSTWLAASKSGDVDTVLSLITDDVVFLIAGQPPMRKADFEAVSRAQAGPGGPQIDGRSEIQEIRIVGDHAYLWQSLSVTVTPPGGVPATRAGHTLTIFRKESGRWRLARDANLLAPVGK
jgi:uncharacterized protein (TIGR02246 family)